MQPEVGLARLSCLKCARASYVTIHQLLQSTSVSCPHCREVVAVADIEAKDAGVSRILGIMRQLAIARTLNPQHGRQASAGADQAAARVGA